MKAAIGIGTWAVVGLCFGACAPETSSTTSMSAAPARSAAAGSSTTSAGSGTLIPAGAGTTATAGRAGLPASAGAAATATMTASPGGAIPPAGMTTPGFPAMAGRPAPSVPTMPVVPVAGSAAPAAPAAGSGGALTPPAAMGDRATTEGVCARWKGDRANLSEGMWSGSVMGCMAGDLSADARENTLRVFNLYRWLADMPAVTHDPMMDMQAQQCALLMRANNSLSHMPPMDWMCYNDVGAKAAGRCNISTGPSVGSVDGYMVDPGNDTTIGHRRWILSNTIGPTGIGGTDKHSCLMTMGTMKVNKPWVAWPAPGIIPIQALSQGFGQWSSKVDMTGWTVQSDTINLASAMVTVTSDGMQLPVTVTQLGTGYGSRYAFRFNPMGWSTTAGKTYSVSVTGSAKPIMYDVTIVDCK